MRQLHNYVGINKASRKILKAILIDYNLKTEGTLDNKE